MKIQIFKGKTEPSVSFVGFLQQANVYIDRFGTVNEGDVRSCHINTKWGQLRIPFRWMKKNIKITVEEEK